MGNSSLINRAVLQLYGLDLFKRRVSSCLLCIDTWEAGLGSPGHPPLAAPGNQKPLLTRAGVQDFTRPDYVADFPPLVPLHVEPAPALWQGFPTG